MTSIELLAENIKRAKTDLDNVRVKGYSEGYEQGKAESGEIYLEQGSFVKETGVVPTIQCPFEPDVIFIIRDKPLNSEGDVKGIFGMVVLKGILQQGSYIAADGVTVISNGGFSYDIQNYGTYGLSYNDNLVQMKLTIGGRFLADGYTYNYVFGRLGYVVP